MNIFALDTDVITCARYHLDKHVVKMILEYSQLLSTAHRILDGQQSVTLSKTGRRSTTWRLEDHRESLLYKATHGNHPSAIWARQSSGNYKSLSDLLVALCHEYTFRYGRTHKCESSGVVEALKKQPLKIIHGDPTPLLLAMPDEYKISSDPVECYRQYIRVGKAHLHSWKKRPVPPWL